MPRGLPDYYNPDTLVSQRLANVEEVVTQLRGFTSIDNRGRILFTETFNQSVHGWKLGKSGDGEYPVISTDEALIEPASMKMDAGTSSGGGRSLVIKSWVIANLKKAGVELGLFWKLGIADLYVTLDYDNGSEIYRAYLRFDTAAKAIKIETPTGWVTVYDIAYFSSLPYWLPVKFVVDFENGVYSHLLVGLKQVDLSTHSLVEFGHLFTGYFQVKLDAQAQHDGDNISYVGLASVTIDEP